MAAVKNSARGSGRAHPRALLLLPAGLCLLAGLNGALVLLGLDAPLRADRLEAVHGPLMVLGFVGTVIALERAVALRTRLGYLVPVLLGVGGLFTLTPAPLWLGQLLLLAGSFGLFLLYTRIWRRQSAAPLVVEAIGSVMAIGAAGLWLAGVAVPFLAPWLVGFLVLTVLGERIELGGVNLRLATGAPAVVTWAVIAVLGYLASAAIALVWPAVGYRLLGLSLLSAVLLVLSIDVARRTVRTAGLTRYMAVAMLAGYAWLIVAAGIWFLTGPVLQGPGYDAVLHAVFLGFVISMIMAHAPVILPAVIHRPLPYRPVLYLPLALLHVSLLLRVLVGDAWDMPRAVQIGGVANIVAVLTFLVLAVASVLLPPPAGGARAGAKTGAKPQSTTANPTPVPVPARSLEETS